jgi:hypothetical protein
MAEKDYLMIYKSRSAGNQKIWKEVIDVLSEHFEVKDSGTVLTIRRKKDAITTKESVLAEAAKSKMEVEAVSNGPI